MNKTIDFDNLDENEGNTSDSDIEIKPNKKEKVYKMKKERAPYVFTDARKEAFEKAKAARELKRDERKQIKNNNDEIAKKELDDKIIKKAEVIKKKVAKKEKILNIEPEDDEPEIIIKKKPKKKIIIVESDSDDEIVIKKKTKPKSIIQPQQPQTKKYVPVYY